MQKDKNFTAIEKRSEVMVAVTMADKLAITMKNYRACTEDDDEYKALHVKLMACSMMALDLIHIELKALTQVASAAEAKRNEEVAARTASAATHHEGNQISLEGAQEIWASPPGSGAKAV